MSQEQFAAQDHSRDGQENTGLRTGLSSLRLVNSISATAEELVQLERWLHAPPPQPISGLGVLPYNSLVTEVRQHVRACFDRPRAAHTNLLNELVQRELDVQQEAQGQRGWNLRQLCDEFRAEVNRKFTFGQVDVGEGPTFFAGSWQIARGKVERPIAFEIHAEGHLEYVERPSVVSPKVLQDLQSRDADATLYQVPQRSEFGNWLRNIYGKPKIGFIEGHPSLGVFAEAVARVCKEAGITNILLPRSRRDPGTKPWHVGAFMKYHEGNFIWSDWGLDAHDAPVKATVIVRPVCRIRMPIKFEDSAKPEGRMAA